MNEPKNEWKWQNDDPLAQAQLKTMLMYYPRLLDDLREWQKRQWHIVYYAFIIIGGLFALGTESSIGWQPVQLAGSLALVLGITAVLILQCACRRSRRNIATIRKTYKSVFDPLKLDPRYSDYWYGWPALLILGLAMLFACAALWLLPGSG